jgi:hypothetical protein
VLRAAGRPVGVRPPHGFTAHGDQPCWYTRRASSYGECQQIPGSLEGCLAGRPSAKRAGTQPAPAAADGPPPTPRQSCPTDTAEHVPSDRLRFPNRWATQSHDGANELTAYRGPSPGRPAHQHHKPGNPHTGPHALDRPSPHGRGKHLCRDLRWADYIQRLSQVHTISCAPPRRNNDDPPSPH